MISLGTFSSFDSVYKCIARELSVRKTISPRGLLTKEMVNVVYSVLNVGDGNHIDFTTTKAHERQETYESYRDAELEWYNTGNLKAASAPSKFWSKLQDERGEIVSNYGHIVFHNHVYP